MPWKTELLWYFSLYLNMYFLSFRIFEQLALALKNRGCPEFTILNVIIYYSGFLSNLCLPWQTEDALKFFTILNIFFIILEFWVTCTCPENRVALEFFTVLHILFTFRIFEQLSLKNRGCTEFTVLNGYFLLFRILEKLALSLKNRVALEFFTVLKYILLFRILEQLALALNNRVALEFFTVLEYILSFRIFELLAVALKTEFALKFFKPGGATPPPTPRHVRLWCTAKMCCAFYWLLNLRRKLTQGRIECEFRISGHTQKSEDFKTCRRN